MDNPLFPLYSYLTLALQGVFIYIFCYRILNKKLGHKDIFKLLPLIIIYSVYMHYTNLFIIEPFRSISAMLLLSVFFRLSIKLKIRYLFFIAFISRIVIIGTMYIALFISGIVTYFIFDVADQTINLGHFLSLFIQIGINIFVYFTILKVKFSFIFYEDKDIGSPFISALTMMLFAYSSLHLLYDNKITMLYWFLDLMFIISAVFFIMYIRASIKKHNEKIVLVQKNDSLRELHLRNDGNTGF